MSQTSAADRLTVLAVDDTPEQLAVLGGALRGVCRVRVANDGETALQIIESDDPPDLILLDVMMPGLSGFDVCRRVQGNPARRDIPIIFITALGDPVDEQHGLELGAIDYLTKPFHPAIVLARVRNQLEIRRQRRELQASYERLQHLEQTRDDLVHMMVHDFRTPLLVVSGLLELVQATPGLPASVASDIDDAYAATWRLVTMTNAVLDVSRMEAGAVALNVGPCNLMEVAQETARDLRTLLGGRVVVVDPAVTDVLVPADKGVIARVFQNLFHNAIKFTTTAGTIRVRFVMAGDYVRCEVTDNGTGVPPDLQARVFDKFVQGKGAGRYSTGLGLPFCRMAIESHGGQIGVTSGPNQAGSTFWFTLPQTRPAAEPS